MSDSSEKPWSNNPTAPQIPHLLYSLEKGIFAGILIGAIFYGASIREFVFILSTNLTLQGLLSSYSFNVSARCSIRSIA